MDPFIGEIKMFSGSFAPRGWAFCDGKTIPIRENTALYSLLGNNFGGDGKETFGLPDLRGRVPLHPNDEIPIGQSGGSEIVSTSGSSGTVAPSPSNAPLAGTPDSNMMPYLTLNYIIATIGLFPPRG